MQVRISAQAEDDLDQIAEYPQATWGWRQTEKNLGKLEDSFNLVAESPSLGRPCDSIHDGVRRFEIARHVIIYLPESQGVLVVRVLHEQMLPANDLDVAR